MDFPTWEKSFPFHFSWQPYHCFLLRFLLTIQHFCSMQSTLVITLNVITTCLLNFYAFQSVSLYVLSFFAPRRLLEEESEYYNLSRKTCVKHVELRTFFKRALLSALLSQQIKYKRKDLPRLGDLIKALRDDISLFTNFSFLSFLSNFIKFWWRTQFQSFYLLLCEMRTQKPNRESSRKKRPLGGKSPNHLTVIIAEHHINLLTRKRSHTQNKRQQETLEFSFHSRSMRLRTTCYTSPAIHILSYICFLFSFFPRSACRATSF